MKVYNDIHELIGNTPIIRLNSFKPKPGVDIYAKAELFNPAGSLKDRLGVHLIEDAEKRGVLHKGDTIIEATSGNTGVGIAFAALGKGYNVIFVVTSKFSAEKLAVMRAYGAELVTVPREGGMLGCEAKVDELLKTIPNSISLRQFENPANPEAYYETLAPELVRDMDGKIDYFVAGAGTGGSFTGCMRYFRDKGIAVKGVLADPEGSIIGGREDHHDYNIEGIGNDFIPKTMDTSLIDIPVYVSDAEAYAMAKEIAKKEGILGGSSSAAGLCAALKVAETIDKGNIVVLFPDRGDRYISKHIYD